MTQDDYKPFCEIVVGFAELKGRTLSTAGLKLYWRAMQSWTLEDFRSAADQLLMTCEYMPEPKDFEKLRKASRPLAGEAWAKVLSFVRSCYRPSGNHLIDPWSEFDLATLRAVESIGGFRAIAMSDTSATHFLEKRFSENYDSMQEVQDTRDALPQIAGNGGRRSVSGPVRAVSVLPGLSLEDVDGD